MTPSRGAAPSLAATGRFALLFHALPATATRPSHWDLLLEFGERLATWELPCPLDDTRDRDSATAGPLRRLPDHRHLYLDYEGPIAGDRGHVTQVATGTHRTRIEMENSARPEPAFATRPAIATPPALATPPTIAPLSTIPTVASPASPPTLPVPSSPTVPRAGRWTIELAGWLRSGNSNSNAAGQPARFAGVLTIEPAARENLDAHGWTWRRTDAVADSGEPFESDSTRTG